MRSCTAAHAGRRRPSACCETSGASASSTARASPRDAEPLVGRAEVLGARVDLDQAALELERPLPGRLGAELGADGEHDVGGAQELLERALVAGRADGERVVGRDRALAHVGGRGGRPEALGERDERRRARRRAARRRPPRAPAARPPRAGPPPRRAGPDRAPAAGPARRRASSAPARRSRPRARRRGSRARPGPDGADVAWRNASAIRSGHLVDAARDRVPLREGRQHVATASAARAGSPGSLPITSRGTCETMLTSGT